MLEDDGRVRKLSSHGVRWRGRDYLGVWMAGQAGRPVRSRHMSYHGHEIEVCDPAGRHLGTAYLADAATPEQLDELRRTRTARGRRLREETKKAEALRRQRFAPATTPTPAQRLGAFTAADADAELAEPYGPFGGLPGRVRVDRGKDFLSKAVSRALSHRLAV